MCHSNGLDFVEEYNNDASVNTLLKALDATIVKVARGSFKRIDFSFDFDDIAQEVRIHIWKLLTQTTYLDGKDGEEAYKYLFTAIRLWAERTVVRYAAKTRSRNKIKSNMYATLLTLSIFNLEFLSVEAEVSTEVLVDRLKEACSDVENAAAIFDFLAPEDDFERTGAGEADYAGLPINAFYKAVSEIKAIASELNYE
jgi:hypothetical protein